MDKLKISNKKDAANVLKDLFDSIASELNSNDSIQNEDHLKTSIKEKLDDLYGISEKILKSVKHSSKDLLSISECSDYFNVSKSLLYKKTSKKELPFYKFGGVIFFNKSEIKEFILSNSQK